MKILIWILCVFGCSAIVTLLRQCGVMIGGIPIAVFYGFTFWLARTLCKRHDFNKIASKAVQDNTSLFDTVVKDIPQKVLYECERNRLDLVELRSVLKQFVRDGEINRAQSDILFEEFSTNPKKNNNFIPNNVCQECGKSNIKIFKVKITKGTSIEYKNLCSECVGALKNNNCKN